MHSTPVMISLSLSLSPLVDQQKLTILSLLCNEILDNRSTYFSFFVIEAEVGVLISKALLALELVFAKLFRLSKRRGSFLRVCRGTGMTLGIRYLQLKCKSF